MNHTNLIKQIYNNYLSKIIDAKSFFNRPLTYTEKILFSHLSKDLYSIPEVQKKAPPKKEDNNKSGLSSLFSRKK